MMKKNCFLILILFSKNLLFGQLNIGGKPVSFEPGNLLKSQSEIPIYETAIPDMKKVTAQDSVNDLQKDTPWRFGIKNAVDLSPENSGITQTLSDGSRLWQIGIRCPGAKSVNLLFSKYRIPQGAVLYIYSADKQKISGGFTTENNQTDSLFATSIITSDNIIVEYYEPQNADFKGILKISDITYGYRGISEYTKDFQQSGACNMNVACPDGIPWYDQIRSVCMILVNSSGFCSGSLINNTNDDGTPYVLTANHCYEDFQNASTWVFWFNWQSATCQNPTTMPSHKDLSGSVLKARNQTSDFCLVKLNQTPPSDYNVFYSGWDNSDDIPTSEVCIHHPQADIKKISFCDQSAVSAEYEQKKSLTTASHWKIPMWSRNTTTEPGSSGSPLFDQNGRIIGQLHGGYAACDVWEADYFGKFSVSWNNGTTADAQLKTWLDPLNINPKMWDGYDPNAPVFNIDAQLQAIIEPENDYFSDTTTIYPKVIVRNRGLQNLNTFTVQYQIDNLSPVSQTITKILTSKSFIEVDFPPIPITYGQHTFKAKISTDGLTDENPTNDTLTKLFKVFQPVFSDDFETDKGWNLSGEFQINVPLGKGGSSGFPDPDQADSDGRILGTDLTGLGKFSGDYEPNLSEDEYTAVSPLINCSAIKNTVLKFDRYLNIEDPANDEAKIQINDGTGWNTVWYNAYGYTENQWSHQMIDISQYADHRDFVLIRYTLGKTNGTNQYSGWNIDNLTVAGIEDKQPVMPLENLVLFPNPNTGDFKIITGTAVNNLNIRIYNSEGGLIYQQLFPDSRQAHIHLKSVLRGIYIMKIQTSTESKYIKFEIY